MMTEEEVLKFWDEHNTFQQSIDQRDKANRFVFYDGPPFATGLPHYGHILASTIKDVIPRFWTMKGKRVERRWGWDCHGLPVENIIEQKLGLKTRKDIVDIGIEKFNEECRACVLEYAEEWKKTIRRMARWVDMEHDYKTMDPNYMESIWWVFKSLWDNGLIYEGRKSMHICPRCETVLSNFEVTQGYTPMKDLSVFPLFRITSGPLEGNEIVAWTTTTWTLPGNVLLAVHPEKIYVLATVSIKGVPHTIILAKERLSSLNEIVDGNPVIEKEFPATELIGTKYEPLFPIFAYHANAFRIVGAPFVSMEDGTGVVHIAPGFGEDDMNLGKQQGVDPIMHVQMNGQFALEVVEWFKTVGIDLSGTQAKPKGDPKQTDLRIAEHLETSGKLLGKLIFTHSYPVCWRCETPLLNYSATSWFVRVTDIKDRMITLNQQNTQWVPEHFREGRFGKWLEGARDWAISRSRFWGTPLPIWRADDGETICIGSKKELENLSGVVVTDLHKHKIDDVVIEKNGKTFQRIPEVLDCWFESGSMPYAQFHYPFENKDVFEKSFPAEFIGEGQDQTRGWFYTLHVLSTALRDSVAFKNVIVNGIVLAEDGKKMSKRLKNYPEPNLIIDKYGADAMRMYLCLSPAMEAESLNFSEKGVDEVFKKVTLTLRNVVSFWSLYKGRFSLSSPLESPLAPELLDQWMIIRTQLASNIVNDNLEKYSINSAAREIPRLIDDVSTWYVRRIRERCKSEDTKTATTAIQTLGWTLRQIAKIIAPMMPMLAESIYQELNGNDQKSVHLTDWLQVKQVKESADLLVDMDNVRHLVSLAHELRARAGIKVRQPLKRLTTNQPLNEELKKILCEETNVKEVIVNEQQQKQLILDTTLTAELQNEGTIRELIRQINALRKQQRLTINDPVDIEIATDNKTLRTTIENAKEQILRSTIGSTLLLADKFFPEVDTVTINGSPVAITLQNIG